MEIIKASGERVHFSEEKLRRSLEKSGAHPDGASNIIRKIEKRLYDGMPTKKIYQMAYKFLKNTTRPVAAKYKLKQALLELGPTGYPFEKLIAKLLQYEGYITATGQIIQGKCVNHEVDVVAQKDQVLHIIECKFHNLQTTFCDVKVPLYIQSRFLDVTQNWKSDPNDPIHSFKGWVVTNTRFSSDGMQYGNCVGLNLLGWDYPGDRSLKQRIDASGLYPITALTTVNKTEKKNLVQNGIVVCQELTENSDALAKIGIHKARLSEILQECRGLMPS